MILRFIKNSLESLLNFEKIEQIFTLHLAQEIIEERKTKIAYIYIYIYIYIKLKLA